MAIFNIYSITSEYWNPRFWLWHFTIPAIVFFGLMIFFEYSSADMWLSGALYEWEGSSWSLYKHWFTYDVIHHWGKRLIHLLGFLLLALWSLSPHFHTLRGLRKYRRSMLYLVLCLVLIPSVIARMKHFTHGPCPIDIINFGGSEIYRHNFSYPFGPGGTGHCYPSGHAGAGFSLLALYFAAYFHLSKKRLLFHLSNTLVKSFSECFEV